MFQPVGHVSCSVAIGPTEITLENTVGIGIRPFPLPKEFAVEWERKPNTYFITVKCDVNIEIYIRCCGYTEKVVLSFARGGHG